MDPVVTSEGKDPVLATVEPAVMTTHAEAPPCTDAPPGDATGFLEMVREHDPMLRALAWRLLGDAHLMDDALQEAYLKAFRARASFRGDSTVGTWLYRITYNVCLDQVRARSRRPVDPLELALESASSAPDPADVATARTDLAAALAALPADQRTAVLLVDAEGMDYTAAAELLGIAPGTVGSRVSRGRAALRLALNAGDLR